jgi:alpha-glucuronidase
MIKSNAITIMKTILTFLLLSCLISCKSQDTSGYDLWLKYKITDDALKLKEYRENISHIVIAGNSETTKVIREEVKTGLDKLLGKDIPVMETVKSSGAVLISTPDGSGLVRQLDFSSTLDTIGNEGFIITSAGINEYSATVIASKSDAGLLYGTFRFLKLIQTGQSIKNINIVSGPKIQRRLLNHWDNLNGTVERGYAGKSLWKWDELPGTINTRYRDYARACASIGINGTVINNVNANPAILKTEYLEKVKVLADVFRPYGLRLYLSINFSSPFKPTSFNDRRGGIGNLDTADPLNEDVRNWWKDKVKEIYSYIPDFGGFLVKANSEGMPGPQDFDRTHADGANMLAEALEPYGGIVMWRAFVYVPDTDPDRAKRSYKEFIPLDGKFHPNVFVQAKNGPIDFQPREPVQPLFGSMPQTPLMLELQITQEYLGHSTHLVYLAPMWKEYLLFDTYAKGKGSELAKIIDGSLHDYSMTGIAGVANTGSDKNWCGHLFAQANWYAFGCLAWDHTLNSEDIADEWIRMTISNDQQVIKTIKSMMMGSWEACINYMTPLGLHHIMQAGFHYGPQPSFSRSRPDWTSVYYHRADSAGLGFDRTSKGSGATSQYFSPLREEFDNLNTCPEKYLLWFHHVDWNYKMASGRTLWDELCFRYYSGTDYVSKMIKNWEGLEDSIDQDIFLHVKNKLAKHYKDAVIWKDTCVKYFRNFSRMDIPDIATLK